MSVRFIFAWYDCWIGVFIDRPKRRVFIFPIPMFGVCLDFAPRVMGCTHGPDCRH